MSLLLIFPGHLKKIMYSNKMKTLCLHHYPGGDLSHVTLIAIMKRLDQNISRAFPILGFDDVMPTAVYLLVHLYI
jgi:hypothetical protein